MRLILLLFAMLSFSAALALTAKAEQLVVITLNEQIPPISKGKARMLFTGKSKSIGEVGRVALLDLDDANPIRALFYETLTGQTIAQVNSKWASLAFSGRGVPPDVAPNDHVETLAEWLANNPNGLAYTTESKVPSGATVLLTLGEEQ